MSRTIRRLPALLLAAALVASLATACAADASEGDRLVVATTSQIGALTRAVAGDLADPSAESGIEVRVLLEPGVNPHDYEPSPADIAPIARAAVVLRNGLGLDDHLDAAIEGAGAARVVTVTEGVHLRAASGEEAHGDEEAHADEGEEHPDPHVWQDPTNAKVMVANIVDALTEAFPDLADTFRANGAAYQARLDEVDAQIASMFRAIPEADRKVVTAHDSLGYFLDRYGLQFVGAVIPSTASGAETSARALADLQDVIVREGVHAIFAESSVDPSLARQLAADAGVEVVTGLYGDTLGPAGSGADTVDGMLLHNATLIADALR